MNGQFTKEEIQESDIIYTEKERCPTSLIEKYKKAQETTSSFRLVETEMTSSSRRGPGTSR